MGTGDVFMGWVAVVCAGIGGGWSRAVMGGEGLRGGG